jgi:methylated-DNA-[protein]-cysteine S-methyltransferase
MRYTIHNTPLAPLLLAAKPEGLCAVSFEVKTEALWTRDDAAFDDLKFQLDRFFQGRPLNFCGPLDYGAATSFQRSVWQQLRKIPFGETRTYGEVAAAIGNPKAGRAVGAACGANSLAIVVPCHRVVAAGGKLGGFSAGLEFKKFLLQLESA